MNCKKRKSQNISFDKRKYRKIEHYFTQAPKEEQSNPNISNVKVESKNRQREKTNTQNQTFRSPRNTQQDQTNPKKKTIYIVLDINQAKNKNVKQKLTHPETDSLYSALLDHEAANAEISNQKDKEMLVCGREGIKGYINPGMPLRCFPEGSLVSITFYKSKNKEKENNQVFARHENITTDCVIFYIHAIGKRKKKILKCGKLHKEGNKLCVYGFKGETIKDVLQRDGRFLSFVQNDHWKLVMDLDTIIENSQPVDDLEGRDFQVEAEIEKSSRVAVATQNSELEKRHIQVLKEYIIDKYPTLQKEHKKITAYIKEESKKRKKTNLFKLHRTEFGKLTKNCTPVKIIKLLSQLSDSVGFIFWDNNGNQGSATCFVCKGLLIFTCRHVINDIVGKGVEPSKWASIISQCVRVTFDFEEFLVKEDNCFLLQPWFEISDVTLDYAVLKLKENGKQVPVGLYNGIAPAPLSGLLYIIGHPDGESKSTDGCAVIPQGERGNKCLENLQAREAAGCGDSRQYIRIYTQRSFQEMLHNRNVVTYDTTFYCGSSGSPVFDSKGSLVAMHTAGFTCPYPSGVSNIIEFGSAMESIFANIKQKYPQWYNDVFVLQADVEMQSQD